MPTVTAFGGLGAFGFGVFPGGALESIATVTVGSGGASSITFSDIPGGFQHLQIRWIGRCTDAGDQRVRMRFNSDSTAANYAVHLLRGDGVTASASAATSYGKAVGSGVGYSGALASTFVPCITDVLDYASTSKNKVVRTFSGANYNTGASDEVTLWSSVWLSTSAITSVNLFWDAGNFAQYSQAALYGVRAV